MRNIAFIVLLLLCNNLYPQFDLNYVANGHEFEPGSTEYLFADNVKFRSAPDLTSEVYELLSIGTKITIIEKTEQKYTYAGRDSHWYKVEVKGKSGYLLGALISIATLTSVSDGTIFYTQIEKEKKDNLILQIRYKIQGNAYKETTISLLAPYLSLSISNGKGLIGVNNIFTINSYSEPCDQAAVIYVFWNGQELNHIAELRYFDTPEKFNRVKFIFPNDDGGIKNKIIYLKEKGHSKEDEDELVWTPVHEEVRKFKWTGKELVSEAEGQSSKRSVNNIIAKKNMHEETKSDIYIKNKNTGKNDFLLTIANVYSAHYHFGEYHNGNVYVIKRIGYNGYPDDDWTDELWKYDQQKTGTKLFSKRGISFRVSPNEEFIAVAHNGLSILNKKGVVLNTYTVKELGSEEWDGIHLSNWSEDSQSLWGFTAVATNISTFFRIRHEDLNCGIEIFHKKEIPDLIETEYEIESNTGQLVYSTFPAIFDTVSYEDYEKENPTIYLKVYDFYTKQSKEIASSKFKEFEPKWTGPNSIEYTDPKIQKRTIRKLIPILN